MAEEEAYPVVERIAQDLMTALATITSTRFTLALPIVRPARLGDWTPADHQVLLVQAEAVRLTEGDVEAGAGQGLAICWAQLFFADLILLPTGDTTVPLDQAFNVFLSAAVKAVMADKTRGGLAQFTRLGEPEFGRDTKRGIDLLRLPIEVQYCVLESDPTVAVTTGA